MARKTKTNLTFQVTLRDLQGVKIPEIRKFIKDALEAADPKGDMVDHSKTTVHLTNKETSYA